MRDSYCGNCGEDYCECDDYIEVPKRKSVSILTEEECVTWNTFMSSGMIEEKDEAEFDRLEKKLNRSKK